MKNIICLLSIVFTFVCYACYDDEGNYDYHDINEVKITNFPEEMVVKFKDSDTLKIEPVLDGSVMGKREDHYDYTWTAILQGGKGKETRYELGKERGLNYFVQLPIGKYDVFLQVLDRQTQVTWRRSFELNVNIATTTGWIVLCDQNGSTRLDMISYAGEKEMMLRDLLKDEELPNKKGPAKILFQPNYSDAGALDRITLITKTGTCYLDPENLTYEDAFDYKYEMGQIPAVFIPTCVASIAPRDWKYSRNILLTTTEVYCRQLGSGDFYQFPRNNIEGEEGTFKVAPVVLSGGAGYYDQWEPPVVLYDTDHNRFVQLELAWDGTSCRIPTVTKEVFPMVTDKDFVYAANTRHESYGSSFIILRDANQQLWLHGLGSMYKNAFVQLEKYYYRLEAPEIEKANLFAIHTYYYYLFYVVGNQIYQFDMVTKENRKLIPLDEKGKEIDFSGEEITFIKFNPLVYGNRKDPEGYGQQEYRLIVGSDKGGENGGIVRMINIKERMADDATLYKCYDGFARPIDIVLRERL